MIHFPRRYFTDEPRHLLTRRPCNTALPSLGRIAGWSGLNVDAMRGIALSTSPSTPPGRRRFAAASATPRSSFTLLIPQGRAHAG
ncbi:hypothetical protein T09_11819 [Trichinella sp. T9]|nr:hypothetical protein T09_11819 [Trichinella sp. T9]